MPIQEPPLTQRSPPGAVGRVHATRLAAHLQSCPAPRWGPFWLTVGPSEGVLAFSLGRDFRVGQRAARPSLKGDLPSSRRGLSLGSERTRASHARVGPIADLNILGRTEPNKSRLGVPVPSEAAPIWAAVKELLVEPDGDARKFA